MKEVLQVLLFLVVFCQVSMCAILLYSDGQKAYHQHQSNVEYREQLSTMTAEEIDQLAEDALDPTTKAQLSLEAAGKRHAKQEQERADMVPLTGDCRPSLSNLSPREQLLRVNEILGTPNEPDPRLQ